MEEMGDEIKEVEQSLADLTARYTTGNGPDTSTDINDPEHDDRYRDRKPQDTTSSRTPAVWDPSTGSDGQSLGMYGPFTASMTRGGAGNTSFRPGRRKPADDDEPAYVHEHFWLSGGESDPDAAREASHALGQGLRGGRVGVPGVGWGPAGDVGAAAGQRRVVLGQDLENAAGLHKTGSGEGAGGSVSGHASMHKRGLSSGAGVGGSSMRRSGGGAGDGIGRGVVSSSGVGFELQEGGEPPPRGQRASPDREAKAALATLRRSHAGGASEGGGDGGRRSLAGGRTSSSSSGVGAGGSKLRLSIVMEHHAEDGDPLVLLSPIEDRLPPLEHSGPRKIRSAAAGEGHL